jgi:hypothetical protein
MLQVLHLDIFSDFDFGSLQTWNSLKLSLNGADIWLSYGGAIKALLSLPCS